MRKHIKTGGLVAAGLGLASIIVAGTVISKRLKSPITSITWSSKEHGKLDIAWYDNEENAVYKVYWSNRKGIRVKDPNTYLHCSQVITLTKVGESTHHMTQININEEWVYVIIAKKGYISSEFEAKVLQNRDFKVSNLDLDRLKSASENQNMAISVAVLDKVEAYRISIYLPDGNCQSFDFYVKDNTTAILKFPSVEDAFVYISAKISGQWSSPEFLIYCENF